MVIPEGKRHIIRALLDRYLEDPRPRGIAEVAARERAVPLYASWTGTMFLRTGGQFFTFDQQDHPGEFIPEPSEHWHIASLTTATRRDPSFAALLPERTAASTLCSFCEGAGYLLVGEKKLDLTCGECAGLGWIDSSLDQRAK